MTILIGGIVAGILGIIGVVIWWSSLLSVLGGVLPILLLIGGGLAVYFGIDELRYPQPKQAPAEGPEAGESPAESAVSTPAAEEISRAAEAEKETPNYWLLAFSAHNVEVIRERGILALPVEREGYLKEKIQTGDRVVLYARSPESQFAGIIEVTGEPTRSSETPFKPDKKGEVWELCRDVRTVIIPLVDNWLEASSLLGDLDLLYEARQAGKELSRSFAAKLREVPQLTPGDYQRIAKALGA